MSRAGISWTFFSPSPLWETVVRSAGQQSKPSLVENGWRPTREEKERIMERKEKCRGENVVDEIRIEKVSGHFTCSRPISEEKGVKSMTLRLILRNNEKRRRRRKVRRDSAEGEGKGVKDGAGGLTPERVDTRTRRDAHHHHHRRHHHGGGVTNAYYHLIRK